MLKKTISYTDFNGIQKTKDCYFNLTKAELVEMEMGVEGGLGEYIQKVVDAKDNAQIMKIFKDFIVKSYGVKSSDGDRFIKSEELTNEFLQTEAYSELFMELCTNEEAAAAFVNGIVPKNPGAPKVESK